MIALEKTIEEAKASEEHLEIVDGKSVIQDRTSVEHNETISLLRDCFCEYIKSHNGSCKVYTENVALFTNELCNDEGQFYLPDLMVVCNSEGIRSDGIHVAPKFVAEVTSPASQKNDYVNKLKTYFNCGVEEYWVVDLQKKVVVTYLLSENYRPNTHIHPDKIAVSVYPGLEIGFSMV